jgi:hypothetical protein
MAEWADDLNAGRDPQTVSARSGRAVWWRCRLGHTWRQAVSDRTRGRGCPACFATRGEREGKILAAVAAATGLRYAGHPAPAPPVRGLRDLVDTEARIVVEYDELTHRARVAEDRRLTAQLEKAGYLVLRIREHGLPPVGGTTIDLHRHEDLATLGRRVAAALTAAGRALPLTTNPAPPAVPRQTPPPVSKRALYPDDPAFASQVPRPSGRPPTSMRDRLRAALSDLVQAGVPVSSPQMVRFMVARTGASSSYANQVLRQARSGPVT